ncbi:MAG TPA: hemolysin family protein, partial [Rhodothermales bacterium]|nr:hemolysin family protein [Rhodothermales bacterium]
AAVLTGALLMAHGVGTRLAGRRATPALSLPVYLLTRLALPIVRPLTRLRTRERAAPAPISAEEVHALAAVGEEEGTLGEEEAALIHSLLEFGDTYAIEAMVSRVDMEALPVTATLDEALALIRASGHSRFPLYGSSLDDILGMVYAKDLLPLTGPDQPQDGTVDWRTLARPARFIPPSRRLDDLLDDFRTSKTHIAIVLDEYGGTLGLITLEDLMEEVVGEIRDELDSPEDEAQFASVGVDTYRADAALDLDDLFELLGMDVDTEDFDFETLGGLVFHLSGLVPEPGDEVTFRNLRLRVEHVEENRIREVLITRGPDEDEGEDGAP